MKRFFIILGLLGLALEGTAQTTGPTNGHLIIAGGALRDTAVFNQFIQLAGGENSHIVVIPTAGGYEVTEQRIEGLIAEWTGRGAGKVSVLHTTDPNESNQEAFAQVLDDATGVYFPGGRQWRLADSYLNTKVQEKLFELLERGGVIAGSSAGATIQGSYLARGDTQNNTTMMGDHTVGLGFVKNIAIDQHTLARNRQFDLFEIIEKHPQLLGIAIDENTAILVSGNEFEVIGQSYVMIYDGTHWDQIQGKYVPNEAHQERFHVLRKGRKYDMLNRKVITN
ncbi:MAG: cyanophycinase [Cytophagia bacterium]|nr:cyanophycinase [Cytophagia bacterium]